MNREYQEHRTQELGYSDEDWKMIVCYYQLKTR